MKLFFFDTETTGVNPHKDRIIQFGAIYGEYNRDTEEFHEIKRINQFINVDEKIPWAASNIHGIYNSMLEEYEYMDAYIDEFLYYIGESDYVIGHNVNFDKNMIIAEAKRAKKQFNFDRIKRLDTMRPTTEFVNGRGGKRPKLIDLHIKLFGKPFDGAHDAMADIIATQNCFLELLKYGFFKDIFLKEESLFLLAGTQTYEKNKDREKKCNVNGAIKNDTISIVGSHTKSNFCFPYPATNKWYDEIGDFENGYAKVIILKEWKYINERISTFLKEFGIIKRKKIFINTKGEEITNI